ncbi:MAG: radical SAM family heme chaperone HemW [Synergistaceae bacterium]|nr:radical SAM family heme chaperone HemW [Synergistaceae bacterium]
MKSYLIDPSPALPLSQGRESSLYVHVPFCEKKCGYCSFYSVIADDRNISAWLEGIAREAEKYSGAKIRTLYIGGGTPTVLTMPQWQKLMTIIRHSFDLSELTEATAEANPNSLTEEHAEFLRDNNFSRISLGVQSLNDDELKALGRIHDSRQAVRAMEIVRDSGLNLSCDLIFATPGQTLRSWDYSLRTVMNYVSHISTYQLTLEPDTPMGRIYGDDDLNAAGYKFYRYAQYFLPKHGFFQYEISSFAREGSECSHNIAYWNHSEVIALGPSASGYIDGVRITNPRTLEAWLSGTEPERETLSPRERVIELAILSLRTKWGIPRKDIMPEIEAVLLEMPSDLFIMTPERIALSPKGMRLGNAIWCELLGV